MRSCVYDFILFLCLIHRIAFCGNTDAKHLAEYQPSSPLRIDLRFRILGRRLSIPKREGYELVRAENLESGAIRPFWCRHCIPIVRQPSGLHMALEVVFVGVSRITTTRLRLRWEFYFARNPARIRSRDCFSRVWLGSGAIEPPATLSGDVRQFPLSTDFIVSEDWL